MVSLIWFLMLDKMGDGYGYARMYVVNDVIVKECYITIEFRVMCRNL